MSDLSFRQLRETNVRRCNAVFHVLTDWTPTDLACAMAGECGEACNIVKKIRRGDLGQLINGAPELAKELADVVIYADLLAARLEIDLGEAVRQKFNEVSDRRSCSIKL